DECGDRYRFKFQFTVLAKRRAGASRVEDTNAAPTGPAARVMSFLDSFASIWSQPRVRLSPDSGHRRRTVHSTRMCHKATYAVQNAARLVQHRGGEREPQRGLFTHDPRGGLEVHHRGDFGRRPDRKTAGRAAFKNLGDKSPPAAENRVVVRGKAHHPPRHD